LIEPESYVSYAIINPALMANIRDVPTFLKSA
jgi:hypothetical protein